MLRPGDSGQCPGGQIRRPPRGPGNDDGNGLIREFRLGKNGKSQDRQGKDYSSGKKADLNIRIGSFNLSYKFVSVEKADRQFFWDSPRKMSK